MHARTRSMQHGNGPADWDSTLTVSQQSSGSTQEPVRACSGGPPSRRHLLGAALLATAVSTLDFVAPHPAAAIAGMVRFPCNSLGNRYFLVSCGVLPSGNYLSACPCPMTAIKLLQVRAGISFAEERGTTVTNVGHGRP